MFTGIRQDQFLFQTRDRTNFYSRRETEPVFIPNERQNQFYSRRETEPIFIPDERQNQFLYQTRDRTSFYSRRETEPVFIPDERQNQFLFQTKDRTNFYSRRETEPIFVSDERQNQFLFQTKHGPLDSKLVQRINKGAIWLFWDTRFQRDLMVNQSCQFSDDSPPPPPSPDDTRIPGLLCIFCCLLKPLVPKNNTALKPILWSLRAPSQNSGAVWKSRWTCWAPRP